jgi:hypothetical protein
VSVTEEECKQNQCRVGAEAHRWLRCCAPVRAPSAASSQPSACRSRFPFRATASATNPLKCRHPRRHPGLAPRKLPGCDIQVRERTKGHSPRMPLADPGR